MRSLVLCVIAAATTLAHGSAEAVVAYIDDVTFMKNGNLFFQDSFTDGAEPPSAPDFPNGTPASYFVNGTLQSTAESGGKLGLNSTNGATITNASGDVLSSLAVVLLSDVNPANLVNGLKIDDTFSLTGVFDLVSNSGPRYSGYGIGFNDATGVLDRRNETNLQVQYSEGLGIEIIRLSYQDFDANSITTLGFLPFVVPAGADQIALTLSRGDVNSPTLLASYSYLDNGQVVGGGTLGTSSVFQDRNFVRGLFFAASVRSVPEPGTFTLLGLGLAGLVAARRRKR